MNENAKNNLLSLSCILNARYRISSKGVPHLIKQVPDRPHAYSICFFNKTQTYRVFYPYAIFDLKQQKWDFKSPEEILKFFKYTQIFINDNERILKC